VMADTLWGGDDVVASNSIVPRWTGPINWAQKRLGSDIKCH